MVLNTDTCDNLNLKGIISPALFSMSAVLLVHGGGGFMSATRAAEGVWSSHTVLPGGTAGRDHHPHRQENKKKDIETISMPF